MSDIRIEFIGSKDVPELVEFIKKHFFMGESIGAHLNISSDCKELEEYCIKSVPENCSFKAVNSKGKMVGALTNAIIERPVSSEPQVSQSYACKNEKFKKILKLFEFINTQFNLFDLYPKIDKYLDAKILVVDEIYRGQGIGRKLTERTIEYSRENNIPFASMMCTSIFSARVCEKLNFKREYALNYADYFVDGENPILPADPHKAVQIFVKKIM